MRNAVVIKSSKAGMTVILDPELPFDELLDAIGKKFSESARFWGSVQMTLTLEGRDLTAAQEFAIVDTITKNSQIEVLCLLDTDAERIERCEKALNDKLMELNSQTGQFYRGTLKRGDCLESEASIVIIGNVDHGARVTAKGNVIVLGELKGTVTAGVSGNPQAVVMALDIGPPANPHRGYEQPFQREKQASGAGTHDSPGGRWGHCYAVFKKVIPKQYVKFCLMPKKYW